MTIMKPFTAETAKKSRQALAAAIANSPYRRDWMDSPTWDSMAQKRGIRLPMWHKGPTPRLLKRWHERLDKEPFEHVYGCSPSRLIALNPPTPLRAFVGMMLERWKDQANPLEMAPHKGSECQPS